AALAADVVAAFAPLVRPLAIDVLLRAYHRDSGEPIKLAHPMWFAVTTIGDVALGLQPSTGGPIRREVDALTPGAVRALIDEAVRGEGLAAEVAWSLDEVRMFDSEVRLPAGFADCAHVLLEVPGGHVGIPIDHRADSSC